MKDQVVLSDDEVKRIVSQFIAKQKELDVSKVEVEHVTGHHALTDGFKLTATYTISL